MKILTEKYGLRYRTATEFINFDDITKQFIMRLMEIAYEKGKTGKNQLED